MKGISHFAVGVAAVSCLPTAVEAGVDGNPLYFIIGGVCGLLPDTLDFKLCRFFYKHDVEVRPDPLHFDSQMIADGVACAVNEASTQNRSIKLKLSSVQLNDEHWQSYKVGFDSAQSRVVVAKGPVVDLGGNEVSAFEVEPEGTAAICCELKVEYFASLKVDIFEGPVLELLPLTEGRQVLVKFLPWHRAWTHSLVIGFVFGLAAWVVWDMWAGIAAASAYCLHALLDQCGFMGCNLWFPFSTERRPGAMKMQSGDSSWNAVTVWVSGLMIFWNLYAAAGWQLAGFTAIKLFFYGAILPGAICLFVKRRVGCRNRYQN